MKITVFKTSKTNENQKITKVKKKNTFKVKLKSLKLFLY